jgi:hypothetical protein
MSNHYHLLLETPEGNLSQIMRHINGAYTTYFNVKRKRVGHLFQGRYKAILVEADEYAAQLSRYIHLNPVRAGMVARPEEHPWSSYRCYIGQNRGPEWLKTDFILGYFGEDNSKAHKRYREFAEDFFAMAYDSPLKGAVASTVLGSPEFVAEVSERNLGDKRDVRNLPGLRQLTQRPSMAAIMAQGAATELRDEKLLRNLSIYCCRQYSGAKLKEIGGGTLG